MKKIFYYELERNRTATTAGDVHHWQEAPASPSAPSAPAPQPQGWAGHDEDGDGGGGGGFVRWTGEPAAALCSRYREKGRVNTTDMLHMILFPSDFIRKKAVAAAGGARGLRTGGGQVRVCLFVF